MRPTPYVASLRVYEPIESFSPVDQLRWSSISIESYTGRDEQLRALRRRGGVSTLLAWCLFIPVLLNTGSSMGTIGDHRFRIPT